MARTHRIVLEWQTEETLHSRVRGNIAKEVRNFLGGVVLPDAEFEYDKDSVLARSHQHKIGSNGVCMICYETVATQHTLEYTDPE